MKKFFTLFAFVLMSCMGAWADYVVSSTPINQESELTDGIYALSVRTKDKSGFLYYNTSEAYTPFRVTHGQTLSTFSSNGVVNNTVYLWKVTKGANGFSLQCVNNNQFISNVGAAGGDTHTDPKGHGNIQKVGNTSSGATAEAVTSFHLGASGNDNGITRWLIYKTQDGEVHNGYPYVHTNDGSGCQILSYWENGEITNMNSGTACKVAFYKVTPVFPTAGTYHVTITGKTSDRYNYLHSDVDKSLNSNQFTWLAQTASTSYNYIWKVVVDENKNASIINAQGTPLLVKKSSSDSNPVVKNTVTFEAHNTSSITGAYYVKLSNDGLQSGHNCLNVSDNNYANGSVRAVTAWQTTGGGTNAADNHWAVEEVTNKDFYDVVIVDGNNASGADFSSATYVTYSGQKVFNGGFFAVAENAEFVKANLAVENIPAGKIANIDVTDNTITVTCVDNVTVTFNYTSNNGASWSVNKEFTPGYTLTESDYAVDFYTNYTLSPNDLTVNSTNTTFNITCEDNFPFTAGKRTRIQSYRGVVANGDFYVSSAGYPYAMKNDVNASHIGNNNNLWKIEHVAGTPDMFTVCHIKTNKYLTLASTARAQATMESEIKGSATAPFAAQTSFFRVKKSTAHPDNGFVLLHPANDRTCCNAHYDNSAGWGYGLGGWECASGTAPESVNDNAMFVLDLYDATIAAGDNGNFGTLCLPYATTVPTGVDAYTLTTLENDHIAFTKAYAAGSTLPANEPVLLTGDNAGTFVFNQTTTSADKVGTNIFLGTPNAEQVDMSGNDIYVLAMDEGNICFMRTTATNVNPYKAYIKTSAISSAKAIKIDFDGPTAINGILNSSENTIFDLSGRKVYNARNGFYIVNGKKVLR